MSDSQQATREQQERMQAAIQNAQIEIQMRVQALGAAVNASEGTAEEVARAATVFLKFLKQGEA